MTNSRIKGILSKNVKETFRSFSFVIKFPRSRGISGSLYLQSAIAGVRFCLGFYEQYAALCK